MKTNAIAMAVLLLLGASATAVAQAPDTIWTRVYGQPNHETGEAIRPTADGNYIVVGSNASDGFGGYDCCLWKIDPDGALLWMYHYGTIDTEMGRSVVQTPDGGYLIAGDFDEYAPNSTRDIYIVKTDSLGIQLSSHLYGGANDDYVGQMLPLPNGTYLVVGSTNSYGIGDLSFWLLYLDADGDTIRTVTCGDAYQEWATSATLSPDSNLVIAGVRHGYPSQAEDVYIVKADMNGNIIWERNYGFQHNDRAYDIKATPDGGYILTGYTTDDTPYVTRDIYVLKTDSNGDTLWTRQFGDVWEDWSYAVNITDAGNYVVAGRAWNDTSDSSAALIIMLNPEGETLWTKLIQNDQSIGPNDIIQTDDGGYLLTGFTADFSLHDYNLDLYLARLAPDIVGVDETGPIPAAYSMLANYPNPFNASTTISYSLPQSSSVTLDIYDILGRKVQTLYHGKQAAGRHSLIWQADSFVSGIYFYRLTANSLKQTRKLILLK